MAYKRKKFSIKTPKVWDYIVWYSTPEDFRPQNQKNPNDYMKAHSIKSSTSLRIYASMEGFDENVYKLRMKWTAYYLNLADEALVKNVKGYQKLKRKYEGQDAQGNPKLKSTEMIEVGPDTSAAECLHRIYGDLTKKEAAGARTILEAAYALDAEDKKREALKK